MLMHKPPPGCTLEGNTGVGKGGSTAVAIFISPCGILQHRPSPPTPLPASGERGADAPAAILPSPRLRGEGSGVRGECYLLPNLAWSSSEVTLRPVGLQVLQCFNGGGGLR